MSTSWYVILDYVGRCNAEADVLLTRSVRFRKLGTMRSVYIVASNSQVAAGRRMAGDQVQSTFIRVCMLWHQWFHTQIFLRPPHLSLLPPQN